MSQNHENLDFRDHAQDLSFGRKSSLGIELTQRIHFWIAFYLSKSIKLVRSQLNSQILSYDHFSGQKSQIFLVKFGHNFPRHRITLEQWRLYESLEARFPLKAYYSKSWKGCTSHVGCTAGVTRRSRRRSPRQGRQNQKIFKFHVSTPQISSFSSFTKMQKFHENLDFLAHAPDTFVHTDFF